MPDSPPPDIEAEFRFLTTEEGGRLGPCKTGYRPNHDFGVTGNLFDAVHEYLDSDWVNPGETVVARLTFIVPQYVDYLGGSLNVGFEFTVQEGLRVVGRGRITKIFNEDLVRPLS